MTTATVEPFDSDAWINECLRKGERFKPTFPTAPTTCRWCIHNEHGFPCRGCECDSSYTSRDDSWQPPLDQGLIGQRLALMHQTGVDGWVAKIACVPNMSALFRAPHATRSTRIRNSLLGKTQ